MVGAGSLVVTCLMVDMFCGLGSCSVSRCACMAWVDAGGDDQVVVCEIGCWDCLA